ncbi:MAG: glycosyltransferase family 4 protein [Campylobacterales bacterium]|nr:glycosyltransferase family 4 protein [Campylobacterales bacterium]
MKRILYIRPQEISKSGIRKYSQLFLEMSKKYAKDDYILVDFNELINKSNNTFLEIDVLLEKNILNNFDYILTEIGLNETREFFILKYIQHYIDTKSFVVLHDAPKSINNLFQFFWKYEQYKVIRIIRRIFNMTLGKSIEKSFFKRNSFIVLSKKALLMMKTKKINDVFFIPLMNFFDTKLKKNEVNIIDEKIIIGFNGFIAKHKGVDLLLKAISILDVEIRDKIKVSIAGDCISNGDRKYYNELKTFVHENELDNIVEFNGFLEDEEMPIFYSSIDFLVLPYRTIQTGSSSGPMKWAMAFGKPMIVSDINTFNDLEDEINCLKFIEGDSSSLALAIKKLIIDKNIILKLTENIILKSIETSPKNVICKFRELF